MKDEDVKRKWVKNAEKRRKSFVTYEANHRKYGKNVVKFCKGHLLLSLCYCYHLFTWLAQTSKRSIKCTKETDSLQKTYCVYPHLTSCIIQGEKEK
jgi:hypothetical protein